MWIGVWQIIFSRCNIDSTLVVGINLQTIYSFVCGCTKDDAEIIADDQSNGPPFSYAHFNESRPLIGDVVDNEVARCPEYNVFDAKR